MHVVYETLNNLGAGDKTIITVFNKCDRPGCSMSLRDLRADRSLSVSAVTGEGLEELKEALAGVLRSRRIYVERFFRYEDAAKVEQIHRLGQVLSEEYREDGIAVSGYMPVEAIGKME